MRSAWPRRSVPANHRGVIAWFPLADWLYLSYTFKGAVLEGYLGKLVYIEAIAGSGTAFFTPRNSYRNTSISAIALSKKTFLTEEKSWVFFRWFFTTFLIFGIFLGFLEIPGIFRDWDFFRGMGFPTKSHLCSSLVISFLKSEPWENVWSELPISWV